MSGQTELYLERQLGEETWELVKRAQDQWNVAEWSGRELEKWLIRGAFREEWGIPPKAEYGLPPFPSSEVLEMANDIDYLDVGKLAAMVVTTGQKKQQRQSETKYKIPLEHIAWMPLQGLLTLPQDHYFRFWVDSEIVPTMLQNGLSSQDPARIVIFTD